MRETTLLRANQDRIVLQANRGGWQVTYYRATSLKSRWMRRLLGAPPVFRMQAHSSSDVQALLLRRGVNLDSSEARELGAMLSRLPETGWQLQIG